MNSLNLNIDMGEGFQNENQWKWGRGNKKTRLRRHWTNMSVTIGIRKQSVFCLYFVLGETKRFRHTSQE